MTGPRICRTADGRYVQEDDPDAAVLAYSQFDDVPKDVLEQAGVKQAAKPADKQASKTGDKARRGRQPSQREQGDSDES